MRGVKGLMAAAVLSVMGLAVPAGHAGPGIDGTIAQYQRLLERRPRDGRLYYRTEDGPMLLIEPNRKQYVERGRFARTPLDGLSFSVVIESPAIMRAGSARG